MSPKAKLMKMVVKIPRHPYFNVQSDVMQERLRSGECQVRKCRVYLERIKAHPGVCPFPLKPKPKQCIVRVARLPDVDRSEISVTPASSIINSDIDEGECKRRLLVTSS
ncbi:hypothetical protein KR018_010565 [Drosophila ironensis]|nr:hypothetical protein KR018_010565 [Drosophila ironensis]